MKSIREYREQLSSEDIKTILRKFNVEPYSENESYIIYPTVDHNLEGGSPKLYYYKKDRMFKSYTGDQGLFDIFQLIIDMHALRGVEISLRQSIAFCGLSNSEAIEENKYYKVRNQLDYLYKFHDNEIEESKELKILPSGLLGRYIYDTKGMETWKREGITEETLIKYNIKYDSVQNAIVIPYYTDDNKLVGVRGRFLNPNAYAKYMPMKYGEKILSHPTSKIIYGLNINKEAIERTKMVVIFEGEKSVMKLDSILGEKNISVALSGRSFSQEHINLLLKYGVRDVILAFDRDYKNKKEIKEEIKDLTSKLMYAKNFFNISLIIDENFVLEEKNSPIDQGYEIFSELMKNRVFL